MKSRRWTTDELVEARERIGSGRPADIQRNPSGWQTKKLEQQEQIWFMDWCRLQTVTLAEADGRSLEIDLETLMVAYPGGAMLQGDRKQRAMHWAFLNLNLMRRIGFYTCVPFGWVAAAKQTCSYLNWNAAERGL